MSRPSFFHKTKKLGDLLIDRGKIRQNQLERALSHKSNVPHHLGDILISLGFINDADLISALSEQLSLPVYVPDPEDIFPPLEISKMFHREHPFAFVKRDEDKYLLLVNNPFDEDIFATVDIIMDFPYEIQIMTESRIRKILDEHYDLSLDELPEEGFAGEDSDIDKLKDMASEAPVIKYVNNLIDTAVNQRASDIHMEPFEDGLRIRFRIDGILYDYEIPPLSMQAAIISRTKLLAALDIAERRVPQDGKISIRISGKEIDLRVSTLPTVHGEGVVIRILEQASIIIDMSQLGMKADIEKQFKKIISLSDGIMLVTGPTGSGKTTTLYCALNFINSESNKIITVEDPVEYQLHGINQIQVRSDIGLTFAAGLRSIVRQDPDIIMIGEIRDLETAEIAVQSSLTGHLVFSTLHTNDAVSAVIRLIDIGVESFLISSSLRGILAQRLVRRICPNCRETRGNVSEFLGHKPDGEDFQLFEGKGCQKCSKTGYSGRIGIYELLSVSEAVSRGISKGLDLIDLKKITEQEGMKTMFADGLEKVKNGDTTFSELIRVTRGLEDGAL